MVSGAGTFVAVCTVMKKLIYFFAFLTLSSVGFAANNINSGHLSRLDCRNGYTLVPYPTGGVRFSENANGLFTIILKKNMSKDIVLGDAFKCEFSAVQPLIFYCHDQTGAISSFYQEILRIPAPGYKVERRYELLIALSVGNGADGDYSYPDGIKEFEIVYRLDQCSSEP